VQGYTRRLSRYVRLYPYTLCYVYSNYPRMIQICEFQITMRYNNLATRRTMEFIISLALIYLQPEKKNARLYIISLLSHFPYEITSQMCAYTRFERRQIVPQKNKNKSKFDLGKKFNKRENRSTKRWSR
jgi:hypothetical protein